MTTTQIEDEVRTYTVLATEDAKRVGCERASAGLEVTTIHGDICWKSAILGWDVKEKHEILVSSRVYQGRTPIEALAKAHRAFCKAVAKKLAEQAEEVGT